MAKTTTAASSSALKPSGARDSGASPCYACVGHVTRDILAKREAFGGTAFYASLASRQFGYRVRAISRMQSSHACALRAEWPEIEWFSRRARSTTTLRHVQAPSMRVQFLCASAGPLRPAHVAGIIEGASVIHLGPIAGEISSAIVDVLPSHTFVGVTAQGFVRVTGADGRLNWHPWHRPMELLRRADVVLLSDEDIAGNPVAGRTYLRQARLGLLTRGPRSIEVYERGSMTELAIAPKLVGDTNGAGDVFAAALFGEVARSGALGAAMDFAVAAAALWVGRPEPMAFPTRARVEQRVRERV